MTKFVFPYGDSTESVYAQTQGELEETVLLLDAVDDTKIYVGGNPYDGLSTDVLLHLDDWR